MKALKESLSNERYAWFGLLIIVFTAGIIRYGLLDVPLERDEGEYAYAGQLILKGIPPYKEVFNMKLPGIYAAYALCLAIFGQTHQGIHFALLIINAITIIAVFLLAKYLVDSLCAVAASASFAVLSVSQSVQGVFANAEHFVIVFAVAGLLVLLKALETKSMFKLFAAGLLLGLSFIMKQHGFAFIALAGLYILYESVLRQSPITYHGLLLNLFAFSIGVFLVFGCLCLIMFWAGVFDTFWFWTVDYASAYISQVPIEKAWYKFTPKFIRIYLSANFLCILSGLGFFALFATNKISKHHKVFLILFAFFSALSICPGFYFRPHYFVLLLTCISLFIGITISFLANIISRFSPKGIQYGIPLLLIAVCLCQSIYKQKDYLFNMTPLEVSRSIYGTNPFPESLEIAEYLQKNTNPEGRIAILGSEPQIFFYANRRSASSYIYMYPLMENHDFALQMQTDFIKDLEAKNPKYMLFVNQHGSWTLSLDSHNKIFKWFYDIQKNKFKLVGIVELLDNKAVYKWNQPLVNKFDKEQLMKTGGRLGKWPLISPSSVAVFERNSLR